MSTKPSERIAELCKGNTVDAWCFAICAYLDEQHAASLPPVEKASVPEPGYCACSVTVVARTPGGATYCKICGRGTRVDPPAAPPPPVYDGPPEPLPATIRDARCVSSGRSCPVAALGGRAGSEEQVYWGNWSNPNRRTWVAVNEIDWRHYRNFQVPAAPPAPERVEGMAVRSIANAAAGLLYALNEFEECPVCDEHGFGNHVHDKPCGILEEALLNGPALPTTDPKPPAVPRGSDGDDEARLLPAINHDGRPWWPWMLVLGSTGKLDKILANKAMNEADLSRLLAALPEDRLLWVLDGRGFSIKALVERAEQGKAGFSALQRAHEVELTAIARERDEALGHVNALQVDIEAEQAGRLELRKRYGAREDETMGMFIARLAEGYEARKAEGAPPVRPAVAWFAEQMKLALRRNDHKGGWAGCEMGYLRDRLREECVELEMALDAAPFEKAIKEAADVANFAMMIADNLRPAEEHGKANEAP